MKPGAAHDDDLVARSQFLPDDACGEVRRQGSDGTAGKFDLAIARQATE